MVNFLEWCGYVVNSPDGKQNLIFNVIDGFLMLGYLILSGINLSKTNPSILALAINAIILCRFIVKNIIEQSRLVKLVNQTCRRGISFIHMMKIVVESVIIIMLTIFFIWAVVITKDLSVVKLVIGFVLSVTFIEDGWVLVERLYYAVPKIIQV